MQDRLVAAGRDPSTCKILPGVTPIIGETESIAKERAEYLQSLEDPDFTLAYTSMSLGADLSKHKTVEEVSGARGNQGIHGSTALLARVAEKERVTLAEAGVKRHRNKDLIGTPVMIADALQSMFESRACDGFVVRPTVIPSSHEQFCRAVVPELQRRGVFRTEYSASTLRGNLRS
jgi:alkanesulfonate monooxygenase SsuD/methylene tetrahydromethanopterin reductase-like flavin-dependent oxidoreductase (luciferase family)